MPVTAATGGEQPPLGSQDELGASTAVDETIPPRAAATDGSDTAAGGADDRAAKVARIDGARTLRDRATLSSTAFYEAAETRRDFSTGARKERGQGATARRMEQLRQSQHELAARSAALDRERAGLRSFLSEQLMPMLNASIQQQAEVEQQAAALEALAEDLQREHA